MAILREVKHQEKYIRWFSDLNKDSGKIAGGKGANLAEIYNAGVAVPPGFVVTAQAYDYFIEKAGIKEKIHELLSRINYEDTKQLNQITNNIRAFITDSDFPKEMEEEILEAYSNLDIGGFDKAEGHALDILNNASEPVFVAVRSSATTEDLAEASFAGQQDTYLNVKGEKNLIESIKRCFASLFTARATYYRNKQGFKHEDASLAVVVQKMVDSNKSGVIFSKDPSYQNDNMIIEAVWGLGEGIVSGQITPDKYVLDKDLEIIDKKISTKKLAITRESSGRKSIVKLSEAKANQQVLKNHEIKKLAQLAIKLEDHYKKPQDIEFAIENEEIFIVQTRPITTMAKREKREKERPEIKGEVVLEGLAASPGIASGKVKIIEDLEDLDKIQEGDVLVTDMTNPDMVVTMQKASAIVTNEGGLTAHAAIVSREMGIPSIVGTKEETTRLKENEIITVDGYTGKIYKGKTTETEKKQIEKVNELDIKTKIKVIVDLPSFAERASKTGIRKVGLTRIEGIIAENGKHPEYFQKQNKIQEYEGVIFKGVSGIAEYFDELWVRTSDIRTDEFKDLEGAPKEVEANPMLGFHGIRYSLKNPDILKAELKALKRISEKGKTIGLLLPQVILVEEVQGVKKILQEIDFKDAKVGVMIETPAAVQIIRELITEGIDFISFGTNDLTQYMLAVDRGNQKVQNLYNEMHPAILYQLEYVIRVCKRAGVETSICGQAGSKKEMVKFLVDKGIDSLSVNADVAADIADYVKELEQNKIKGTDKEPRQYEQMKQEKKIEEKQTSREEPKKPSNPPMTFNPGIKQFKPDLDKIKKEAEEAQESLNQTTEEGKEEAVEEIKEEKKEYLEKHPEENKSEEEILNKEIEDEIESELEAEEEKIEEKGETVNENEEKLKESSNSQSNNQLDIF